MESIQKARQTAEALFSQGRYADALSLLEQLERLVGPFAELANDMAVVHYRLGNVPKAMHYFRNALSLQGEAQHRVSNNLLAIIEEMNAGGVAVPLQPSSVSCVCPVCNSQGIHFKPIPAAYRQIARSHGFEHFGKGEMTAHETYSCSACGASDRERLYAFWINQQMQHGALRPGDNVIHFAPEACLSRVMRNSGFKYATADLGMAGVDYQVDLQNLPFESESFDFFICSHVLEHVASDDAAIQELLRVTRKGGFGILMAPIIVGLETTLEDPNVTDPAERWRLYGQDDHVRLYAHDDYVRKIEENGFLLDQLGIDYFGEVCFEQLGLKKTSVLYIARRPG